jgi:hypothetical protein
MMNTEKTFDCVKMKDGIQQKLQSRWQGLSGPELVERIKKDIDESDSPVAEWWRRVEKRQTAKSARTTAAR